MNQEEFIIEITEVRHVKVQAGCFLEALAIVWDYDKEENLVPDPLVDITRRDPLRKKVAGLSWIDKRYDKD